MKPLHEKHGSKKNPDGSFDFSNKKAQVEIITAYNAALSSGDHQILGGSEIDLGGGKWVRTFVIDENAKKTGVAE